MAALGELFVGVGLYADNRPDGYHEVGVQFMDFPDPFLGVLERSAGVEPERTPTEVSPVHPVLDNII